MGIVENHQRRRRFGVVGQQLANQLVEDPVWLDLVHVQHVEEVEWNVGTRMLDGASEQVREAGSASGCAREAHPCPGFAPPVDP